MKNKILKVMYPYLKMYRRELIWGSFLILVGSLLNFPSPFIIQYVIDFCIPNKDMSKFLYSMTALFVFTCISYLISYTNSIIFTKINNRIIMNIRKDLLEKIIKAPKAVTRKMGIGYLISRVNDDTNMIKSFFADKLTLLIKDVLAFCFGMVAIYLIYWKLALITTTILPVFVVLSSYFSKLISNASLKLLESYSNTTQELNSSFHLIDLTKYYSRYDYSIKRYENSSELTVQNSINFGKISSANSNVLGFIVGLIPIIILLYGGNEILNSRLSMGSIIAFNSLVMNIFGPILRFINFNVDFQKSCVALNRIDEILSFDDETRYISSIFPKHINKIQLRNIEFSYDQKSNVLKNLSLAISKGERIGIVGPSGCGKTTILKLLCGLYPSKSGEILLNQKQIEYADLISLRDEIAMVDQEPLLLDDTIYNNILFGKKDASYDEVVNAARLANVDEFADTMNDRLNTMLGKNGIEVSIGQKQRIAIARALVRKPQILLLDEITSNIDNISEKYIINTIFSLSRNITVIIIAHRLDIIKKCDRIIVMNEGEIKSIGKHKDLLNENELYKEMSGNIS